MRDYKKIKAYQLADELVIEIYKVSKNFPKDELYGFTSQIRRAALSIPTNIAEGASRQHKKDYLNFLYVARGSAAEVEYLLDLGARLHYLPELEFQKLRGKGQEILRTLFGLISSVEQDLLVEV